MENLPVPTARQNVEFIHPMVDRLQSKDANELARLYAKS